jgi:prophage regulatory protein
MDALREGREPDPPSDDLARAIRGLLSLMGADPDLFRAALEYIATMTPVQEILRRPAVIERMREVRDAMKGAPPVQFPGPDRRQLPDLLQGWRRRTGRISKPSDDPREAVQFTTEAIARAFATAVLYPPVGYTASDPRWRMADRILRLPGVKAATGLSRSTIYNLVGAGAFPRPVQLGPRAVGWLESEVDAWANFNPRRRAISSR